MDRGSSDPNLRLLRAQDQYGDYRPGDTIVLDLFYSRGGDLNGGTAGPKPCCDSGHCEAPALQLRHARNH